MSLLRHKIYVALMTHHLTYTSIDNSQATPARSKSTPNPCG